ncbi:MAG TPA: tetratricopeptide repeat protein [Smithella sp.]|nr:tetratricopeptide repeat protein [Smithella sp.]HRS96615.1 tetratricopeptide repeat protein [Smithella sp.]
MASKISKKDLNLDGPDKFQSTMELITDYIAENKKRFYSIVAGTVLAVFIAVFIYLYWSHYQYAAREMYAKSQKETSENVESPEILAKNIKIYKELTDKYPHSWSARMAHYHLGNLYYHAGELDNAIASYKKFVASRISDAAGMKFLALTSIGYCYEARKDYKSALEYFEKAQKNKKIGFESMALRNIARMYELMNNRENALENYRKALEKTKDPSMAVFIKYKISTLS